MTIEKSRGATKKLRPISLGRKIVRFTIRGNDERHFTVHENIICSRSVNFKQHLQKIRKKIGGECPICHEILDPRKRDVAFCRGTCGQNIHEKCIQQWTRTRERATTCPMCRQPWATEDEGLIMLKSQLDPDAVQLYVDWLYTGQLHIDEALDHESEEFNIHLLKAWIISEVFDDLRFNMAIIAEHCSMINAGLNKGFGLDTVEFAFKDEMACYMRGLVVESVHAHADCADLEANIQDYPAEFVRELCLEGLRFKNEDGSTAKDTIRKKWAGKRAERFRILGDKKGRTSCFAR